MTEATAKRLVGKKIRWKTDGIIKTGLVIEVIGRVVCIDTPSARDWFWAPEMELIDEL